MLGIGAQVVLLWRLWRHDVGKTHMIAHGGILRHISIWNEAVVGGFVVQVRRSGRIRTARGHVRGH